MITNTKRISLNPHFVLAILLTGILMSYTALAQDNGGRRSGRLAPSPLISCDHNQLTSWTGVVTGYHRLEKSSWLEISTDADTVEQTTLEHDDALDASAFYLLWGQPFKPADFKTIETAPGVLINGMRATAWICSDGNTPPVIDWQPGRH